MLTVVQAFDKMLQTLEVTESERNEVNRQQKTLRDGLAAQLPGVLRDFTAGAYSRGVATRPLSDIDVFVVLDEATHGRLRDGSSKAGLEALHGALASAFPGKASLKPAGRSVNVQLGMRIGFDVTPAFEAADGVYLIPDKEQRGWIRTNPEALREVGTHAHERAAAKLYPVVRVARHWNAAHGRLLGALHLEALAVRAILTPPLNYPGALRQFFAKVADSILRSCPDPAGVGPVLDIGMSSEQKSHLRMLLQDATRQADQALQFDRTWRAAEAHAAWRTLLGADLYPDVGR